MNAPTTTDAIMRASDERRPVNWDAVIGAFSAFALFGGVIQIGRMVAGMLGIVG